MAPEASLPLLLGLAWLLPLASFTIIVLFGPKLGKAGIMASYVATGAIIGSFLLSMTAFGIWHIGKLGIRAETAAHAVEGHATDGHDNALAATPGNMHTADEGDHGDAAHGGSGHGDAAPGEHHGTPTSLPKSFTKDWYSLAQFGPLKLSISYYIDSLTILMFSMVTLIASLIHFYAFGYMHDELHPIEDHEVVLSDGHHLHRPGRFYRFFQYLSLFCFSMLGLVIAGNILMVFVFWELVGICSYFLIGFYIERKSASNAANKAFIVNRVGDFGMIIGLMALWGSLGTFAFGDIKNEHGKVERGIFSSVRPPERIIDPSIPQTVTLTGGAVYTGQITAETAESIVIKPVDGEAKTILLSDISSRTVPAGADGGVPATVHEPYALRVPDGMVKSAAMNLITGPDQIEPTPTQVETWRNEKYGYWLLVIAGLGIFCGCIGKSAQFPLHVWLPDAMEGPTPVSALVHSATMVAAGVYLAGRFFPVFTGEVLLIIAYVGAITLFMAATIAITAVDIKRVLAYSTVSQLGYMMLGIGLGGWAAGLFHLVTHAFFKSLLFMCSGSVIHATHTNDMRRMGGLRHKMPWTAYTMLVGVLAIYGAAIPFVVGFSGHYSKDSIIAQALSFWDLNPRHGAILAGLAIAGSGITAFYMFRMWFMTFAGKPRDHHVYEHVHESPPVMYIPLVVLSVFAFAAGFNYSWQPLSVPSLIEQARYPGAAATAPLLDRVIIPEEFVSHEWQFHSQAEIIVWFVALGGLALAVAFYGLQLLNADEAKKQFAPFYKVLWNKYYFDELYAAIFVKPVMFVAKLIANFDRWFIDGIIHRLAAGAKQIAVLDDAIDRYFVDGLVNLVAAWTWSIGNSLRRLQTGSLRQYVMLIVIGTVALTLLVRWSVAAGN